MKAYLASPFFNDAERETKQRIKKHLVDQLGIEIIDPQPNGGSNFQSWELSNSQWGYKTFNNDIAKIDAADVVIAIDWGMYSDTGTAWEIGFACAKGKKVLVIVPDECVSKTHSLMVSNGCVNFIVESRLYSLNTEISLWEREYYAHGVHVS